MLAFHPARDIRPADFTIGEAALTRLEHLDVVWRGESSRTQKSQKVIEPQRRVLSALVRRRQSPRVYLHVVGGNGVEGPNGDSHDVVDHQIRKYSQVTAGLGDKPRPLCSEPRLESPPDFLEVRLAMLAEGRDPVRDWPSPRALIFHHRVPVPEIYRLLIGRSRYVAAFHIDTYITQEAEVPLMRRQTVIAVIAVLDQQLPVGSCAIGLLARDNLHT